MDDLIKDPVLKTNVLFMILGVMLGMLLSICRSYLCDTPTKKSNKT